MVVMAITPGIFACGREMTVQFAFLLKWRIMAGEDMKAYFESQTRLNASA
jgi:hypothetical protein